MKNLNELAKEYKQKKSEKILKEIFKLLSSTIKAKAQHVFFKRKFVKSRYDYKGFDRHKQKIVSEELYDELLKSKELRVGSLYYDKDFGKEDILKRAQAAPDFCLKMESIVDKLSKGEIAKIRNKFETLSKMAKK